MQKKASILGLIFVLALAAYLDSPFSFLNNKYSYTADQPVMAKPAGMEKSADEPETIDKLKSKKKADGYIVETYEEYDVYKDKNGTITKEVPTGKTDTLKYWDYANEIKEAAK